MAATAPRRSSPGPAAPPRMRLLRSLGEGGMGALWLAERTLHGGITQRVVVKRPRVEEGGAVSESLLRRFTEEARSLARVRHGNVVGLLDVGVDADGHWMVIEHVDGLDAHALMVATRAGERLGVEEVAWIAHEAARGMSAAHGLRDASGEPTPILHRDLSPQNLLLSCVGEVKVTDFGIAWAVDRETRTTTGVVVGNLRYIAPEQLEGRAVGPTTDVYGIGRVMEELLEVTAEGGGREALRVVATRATRRAPEERHDSMEALAEAVLTAVPGLCNGRRRLAERVEALARSRTMVQSALAGLLAAERPGNDRVSVPSEAKVEAWAAPARTEVKAAKVAVKRGRYAPMVALGLVGAVALAGLIARGPRSGERARVIAAVPVAASVVVRPRAIVETPRVVEPTAPRGVPPAVPQTAQREEPRRAQWPRRDRVVVPTETPPQEAVTIARVELATLRVNTIPYARVAVDDGPSEGVPATFRVSAGEHHVRAYFEVDGGTRVLESTVTLRAGETRNLGIQL